MTPLNVLLECHQIQYVVSGELLADNAPSSIAQLIRTADKTRSLICLSCRKDENKLPIDLMKQHSTIFGFTWEWVRGYVGDRGCTGNEGKRESATSDIFWRRERSSKEVRVCQIAGAVGKVREGPVVQLQAKSRFQYVVRHQTRRRLQRTAKYYLIWRLNVLETRCFATRKSHVNRPAAHDQIPRVNSIEEKYLS